MIGPHKCSQNHNVFLVWLVPISAPQTIMFFWCDWSPQALPQTIIFILHKLVIDFLHRHYYQVKLWILPLLVLQQDVKVLMHYQTTMPCGVVSWKHNQVVKRQIILYGPIEYSRINNQEMIHWFILLGLNWHKLNKLG